MKWLERLLGRPVADAEEREQDEAALDELRSSLRRVRVRTDKLVDDYRLAESRREGRRKPR